MMGVATVTCGEARQCQCCLLSIGGRGEVQKVLQGMG